MKNIITVDKLHYRRMILITIKKPKHATFIRGKKCLRIFAFNYFVVSLSFRTKMFENSSVNGTFLAENL